ncbi:MAG: hypothetical protein ACRDSH_12130 [Pseudonocardiaceae bacterium]
MGNSVDTRAVEARGCKKKTTRGLGINQVTQSDVHVDQATNASSVGGITRSILPHGPYRKTHDDFPYIRIIVTSAIIAGLLLSTAPAALAQVGTLFSVAPPMITQDNPARENIYTDSIIPPDKGVVYKSDGHHAPFSISWNGTTKALKCSYGLLIEGNTRSC